VYFTLIQRVATIAVKHTQQTTAHGTVQYGGRVMVEGLTSAWTRSEQMWTVTGKQRDLRELGRERVVREQILFTCRANS